MATNKRTTEEAQEQSVEASESVTDVTAMAEQLKLARKMIDTLHKQHDQLEAALKAQGVHVEEPPNEITAYRQLRQEHNDPFEGTPRPRRPGGSAGTFNAEFPYGRLSDSWWPWTKEDLEGGTERHDFVPQYIPGIVHPLRDKDGKFKIFLNVNDLGCCLTVGVLNKAISGMFYHVYMNAEEAYLKSEEFKSNGPLNAIWVSGGLHGTNTWHFEPEVPNPWIDINGRYYTPGSEMPGEVPDSRPTT